MPACDKIISLPLTEGAEWPPWREHGQRASTPAAPGCARWPPMIVAGDGVPACGPRRRTSSGSRSRGSGGAGTCAVAMSRVSSSPPAECGLRPSGAAPRAACGASPAGSSSSQTRARSLGHRLHRARARCPGTMDTTRRARPAISRRGLRFLPRADVARARRRSAGSALREGAGRRGADRRLRAARHTPGTGRERHGAARRRRGSRSARLEPRSCRARSAPRGKDGGELGREPHGRGALPRPGVALGATTGTAYRAARAARERPGRRRASSRRPRALSARGTRSTRPAP